MSALIGGRFKLANNVNFWQHLVALGVPKDKAKEVDGTKPIVEVKVEGKVVTFSTETDDSKILSQLIIEKEVVETLAYNIKLKSTTIWSQNQLTVRSKGPNGERLTRLYEFTNGGLVMTLKADNPCVPVAKRYFLRQ